MVMLSFAVLRHPACLRLTTRPARAPRPGCRYADEEAVSDDEDMLRAFWSDEGAAAAHHGAAACCWQPCRRC